MTNLRAAALAERLQQGASALADCARTLSEAEWHTRLPGDNRKVGVVLHHVASVYPLEVQLALTIAEGKPISGVTMDDVHAMNAKHASDFEQIARDTALDLLQRNSAAAADAVRALSDEQLNRAAPASLYGDAPMTCLFVLKDHAVRHSYHHLMGIRRGLKR